MANARFYLKDTKATSSTLIYLNYSYDGKRLKYSTGETVAPKSWLKSKQQVRASSSGSGDINDWLNLIEETANTIYRRYKLQKEGLSNQEFRDELNKALSKDKRKAPTSFFDIYDEFVETRKRLFKPGTIKKYVSLKNHLTDFQSKKRIKIDFESIDNRFYDKLVWFFAEDKQLLNNSTGKYIATLKTFLKWSSEEGYNSNMAFKDFTVLKNELDTIFLTDDELDNLFEYDLKTNKRLEKVRDAFCLACYTGLRFSDFERLRRENIKKTINITCYKTGDPLKIPITKNAQIIIDKYIKNPYFLEVISNQKMNDYLKELAKLVGIDILTSRPNFRGKNRVEVIKPKYEFISTHTARRTFITLSLMKGMRAEIVMKITGHKSYSTFKKYIGLADSMIEEEMIEAWDKKPTLKKVV